MPLPKAHADSRSSLLWVACSLLLPALAVFCTQARATTKPESASQPERTDAPLAIKVYDDRMTIDMAGAAQVYLYGVIDAGAPERLAALMKSWKIPRGSDVYLNASGDNIDAGMAVGRLLRSGGISTHLGRPTRGARAKHGDKSSLCTGACVYAYLGGVYRWVPTGNDRFGIASAPAASSNGPQHGPQQARIADYVKTMGIAPAAFAAIQAGSRDAIVWPTATQMIVARLANNGRQPLIASYGVTGGIPHLQLAQILRRGEQRLTLQCQPGSVSLSAYNKVGADRAQQIVRHVTSSYLDIDGIETLSQPFGGATVDHDSVMVERAWPADQLGRLLAAKSVGAWINQPNGRLRSGFVFPLDGLEPVLKTFYDSCWKYAPWPVKSVPSHRR